VQYLGYLLFGLKQPFTGTPVNINLFRISLRKTGSVTIASDWFKKV
jgi:hypothetical protein